MRYELPVRNPPRVSSVGRCVLWSFVIKSEMLKRTKLCTIIRKRGKISYTSNVVPADRKTGAIQLTNRISTGNSRKLSLKSYIISVQCTQ